MKMDWRHNWKKPFIDFLHTASHKIPRKGRIRALLLLIALLCLLRLVVCDHKETAPSATRNLVSEKADRFEFSIPMQNAQRWFEQQHIPASGAVDTLKNSDGRFAVHYTLDSALQAESHKLLKRYHPECGAVVALGAKTGRILVMATYSQNSGYSGALCTQSLFPLASLFKIVTASAAMQENLLQPESQLDLPGNPYTLYNFQLREKIGYADKTDLTRAFARSMNPVFGRIGIYQLGPKRLTRYAEKFGFGADIPFDLPVDTSSLMSADSDYAVAELASGFNRDTRASPLHAALIASIAGNQGKMMEPYIVQKVFSLENGKQMYSAKPRVWKTPLSPDKAWELKILMRDVIQTGNARKSFSDFKRSHSKAALDYGGKTGSINYDRMRIDWFNGFITPASGEPMAIAVLTTHGPYWTVHSSYIASQLFDIYMKQQKK